MSFWDDLTGKTASDASNAAAADTYGKQKAAAGATRQAGADYSGRMTELAGSYDPYANAGGSALERLMAGLGLGGGSGGGAAFTEAYRGLPGYQAGLDTGSKTVATRLNAGPGIQSGGAMKALQRYGQDYEDQKSGDYLSRLATLTGTGLDATGRKVATTGAGYGGQFSADTGAAGQEFGAAGTIGQGQIAGANAQAAGSQNLLNTGIKLGGMALGAFGMPGVGSSFGTSTGASPMGSLMSSAGSNPFNPNGTRNTMAYGYG